MSDRPTFQIETPFGSHKVVIREWITGRERAHIQEPIMSAVQIKPQLQGGQASLSAKEIEAGGLMAESERRELATFVVSVDGKTENVADLVLDMHEKDTEAVKDAIAGTGVKKGAQTGS